MNYRIVRKRRKPSELYGLYWKEKQVFLDRKCLRDLCGSYSWKYNPVHQMVFRDTADVMTKPMCFYYWKRYEHQRIHDISLPQLDMVEIRTRGYTILSEERPVLTDADIVEMRIGTTLAKAMDSLPKDFKASYAIKRSGKSAGICAALSEGAVIDKSPFTFFVNEDDLVLVKIALGAKLERIYDIKSTIDRFREQFNLVDE